MRKHIVDKQEKSIFLKILVIISMLFLTGCPRIVYLTFIDTKDPAYPFICVSMKKNCRGDEVSFGQYFSIFEVDENGKRIKDMWTIKVATKASLKKIKYGSIPAGWSEIQKAIPLELGKTYEVEGGNYFILKYEDDQVKAEIQDLQDFLKNTH